MSLSSTPQPIFNQLKTHAKGIFLSISILFGILILWPYMDFQPYLSQGDHGRDLYAFEQGINQAPYKDYWWVYGPLMPYYYHVFEKWLGVNIVSVLIAENALLLVSGVLIFLCMAELVPLSLAFCAALWFWVFQSDFFFTYNHTGGVTVAVLSFYMLLLYFKKEQIKFIYGTILACFILSLIKVNFGFACLAGSLFCWAGYEIVHRRTWNKQKRLAVGVALLSVILTVLIYKFLLRGLSIAEIRQCLPYLSGDQPYETSMFASLQFLALMIWQNMQTSGTNMAVGIILNSAFLYCFYRLATERAWLRSFGALATGALAVYLVLNFHEFLKSGVLYRSFWAKPFQVMLMFGAIGFAVQKFPKIVKYLVTGCILFLALSQAFDQTRLVNQAKVSSQYLSHPKAKIFVQNSPGWIDTVNQTTSYLDLHLQPQEKFFALPYDCLYYYLTGRQSPTRQLIFFEHIKIPTEQEEKIIQELDAQKINYVVISSRAEAREHGLGILGTTYCPLIGRWLEDNFEVVAGFGDWKNEPGWAWNHGTKILKRKERGKLPSAS